MGSEGVIDSPDFDLINEEVFVHGKALGVAEGLCRRGKTFLEVPVHENTVFNSHSDAKPLIFIQIDEEVILSGPFVDLRIFRISSEGKDEHLSSTRLAILDAIDQESP